MAFWKRKKKAPARYVAIREWNPSRLRESPPRLSPKVKRFGLVALGAGLLYFFVVGEMGLTRLFALNKQKASLEKEELSLMAQLIDLDTRNRLLKTDTLFIEGLARSEFHLSRPGEVVYQVTPAAPASPNSNAAP